MSILDGLHGPGLANWRLSPSDGYRLALRDVREALTNPTDEQVDEAAALLWSQDFPGVSWERAFQKAKYRDMVRRAWAVAAGDDQ